MDSHHLLLNTLIYLVATVAAVPLSRWLGLVGEVEQVLHFAEFGVVLLLFIIGLELNPRRLWSLRRPIFGFGGAQVVLCALALGAVALLFGANPTVALVAGLGLALSSTALVIQVLTERNLLSTPAGSAGFSILLFQDIAVIPLMALLPALGTVAVDGQHETAWMVAVKAGVVIALVVAGGRYLSRPLLRHVARTGLQEVFTACALALVVGAALLMETIGLSMALGAFLGGVLLADSEYRHALESTIEPFKGLLLGLFFVAVGMSLDFGQIAARPALVVGLVVSLVVVKAIVLFLLAWVFRIPLRERPFFALVLSQGGEFAFVLFSVAAQYRVLDPAAAGTLVAVVALSMVTTPLLLLAHDRVLAPRLRDGVTARPDDAIADEHNPVIIAGFGRFGQIVTRLLQAHDVAATIIDHDPDHVERVRRFGFKSYYGDAARIELLEAAGLARARVLVLAIDDRPALNRIAAEVRERYPGVTIVARAWDMPHVFELMDAGAHYAQRETFDDALATGVTTLRALGFGARVALRAAQAFRRHDEAALASLYAVHKDEGDLITETLRARAEIEELLRVDRSWKRSHGEEEWG